MSAPAQKLTDEDLIRCARGATASEAQACLSELFERSYPLVARWCLKLCNNREDAADLAQEVMTQVHKQLDSFRLESRFTTWVYTITRRTTINRGIAEKRRAQRLVAQESVAEPADDEPGVVEHLNRGEVLEKLRATMTDHLAPAEARVVYLHYVDGMTLPAITRLMQFENKSGAKAYLVAGMRKLRRHMGPWLARSSGM
ncbi:MAG: RNA polymerase sigma factor [Pseudomonadota bacterium]